MVNLAIKYNNTASNDPCAICGGRTDPLIPLAIFPEDSYQPVCDRCAIEHAPGLVRLVDVAYSVMQIEGVHDTKDEQWLDRFDQVTSPIRKQAEQAMDDRYSYFRAGA